MIELNKVGIEIGGKVYEMYKLNFGYQRKLLEIHKEQNKLLSSIAKRHGIEVSEIYSSDKVTVNERLEIADGDLKSQESMECLFVNKEDAVILKSLNSKNAAEIITALR